MSHSFLGRGWSFPPIFNLSTAGVGMLEDEDDIASSLEILLTTVMGERIMLPEYGCNLDEMLFESLDSRIKTLVTDKVESAILYHEPRVRLEDVRIEDGREAEGVVIIDIVYRVKATNSRFNFVFPYYKSEATDLKTAPTINALPDKE